MIKRPGLCVTYSDHRHVLDLSYPGRWKGVVIVPFGPAIYGDRGWEEVDVPRAPCGCMLPYGYVIVKSFI